VLMQNYRFWVWSDMYCIFVETQVSVVQSTPVISTTQYKHLPIIHTEFFDPNYKKTFKFITQYKHLPVIITDLFVPERGAYNRSRLY
jgi:hypothetical protein